MNYVPQLHLWVRQVARYCWVITDICSDWNQSRQQRSKSFTAVLTYDDPQGEDEEGGLPPHLGGYGGSKLPPGILPPGLPKVNEVQPAITALEQQQQQEKRDETKESKYDSWLGSYRQQSFWNSGYRNNSK